MDWNVFWAVFLGVLAAFVVEVVVGALAKAWMETKKSKDGLHSGVQQHTDELKAIREERIRRSATDITGSEDTENERPRPKHEMTGGYFMPFGSTVMKPEDVEWEVDQKYMTGSGDYDIGTECYKILQDLADRLITVRNFEPLEEYAPGGNLGLVGEGEIREEAFEMMQLLVCMEHKGAVITDMAKIAKYMAVLDCSEPYELDWKQAKVDFGIDYFHKKYEQEL